MTRKFEHIPRIEGSTDEEHIEHFLKVKYRSLDEKTDTQKFLNNEVKIQKDIYSYAYAAIIHPNEIEDLDPKKKYIPKITLLKEERNQLYLSAALVTLVQASTILLIVVYFEDGDGVHLIPAKEFYILIPRLISSIMMHLNVEPDIRQGIELMKYAINHPQKFRPIKKNYEKETAESVSYLGAKRRAFCAFLLGFNQATIAIVAEILVIVFLNSLSSLLLIIMKYVSLAAVVKFDDMYAASLGKHVIQGAANTKLFISNKRRDRILKAQ